ncbi:MAG: hypothetical protein KI792_08100 [Alphaproteobacteria bacterium]|nr:hypothetical protein [Alphaproteobacteria bacterium SS10]
MIGKWLRGPDAETVTLETIGLIKGAKDLDGGPDNASGNTAAEKYAKRIDTVLARDRRVLSRDVRDMLTKTRDGLQALTGTKASFDTGRRMAVQAPISVPIHEPNPAWKAKLHALKSGLDEQATRIFDREFAYDVLSEHNNKPTAEVERAARRDLSVGIAMKMGKL